MRLVLLAPLLPQHCSRQGQQVARDDRRDGRTSQLPYIGQVGIGHKRTAKYIIRVKKTPSKIKGPKHPSKKAVPQTKNCFSTAVEKISIKKTSTLQSKKNLDPPKLDSRLASRNHLPPKKHFVQIKNGISAAKKNALLLPHKKKCPNKKIQFFCGQNRPKKSPPEQYISSKSKRANSPTELLV